MKGDTVYVVIIRSAQTTGIRVFGSMARARREVVGLIKGTAINGGALPGNSDTFTYEDWVEWWKEVKGHEEPEFSIWASEIN